MRLGAQRSERRMGLLSVPVRLAVPANFLAWLVIHLGAAYIAWRMPRSAFTRDCFPYRLAGWEVRSTVYRRALHVNRWKRLLPDGARVFPGGFAKAHLKNATPEYLESFMVETRRAELTHWLAIVPVPIFLLWNHWWAVILIAAYALGANLPCVLAQRHNRSRLGRVLNRVRARSTGL